jgi:hypothetical protein
VAILVFGASQLPGPGESEPQHYSSQQTSNGAIGTCEVPYELVMKAPRRLCAVSFTILVIYGALKGTQAACEGNSCPQEAHDAHKAGLLGGAVIKQCSHTKDYPTDGTKLQPVRAQSPWQL